MKLSNNKKDIPFLLDKFSSLLDNQIDARDIFWILDSIMHKYSMYIIENNEPPNDSDAEELYYLKILRNLFVLEN